MQKMHGDTLGGNIVSEGVRPGAPLG